MTAILDRAQRGVAEARERIRMADPYRLNGRVSELIGLVVESQGPPARIGERCTIHTHGHRAGRPPLDAEVVGFRSGHTLLMPLGDASGIGPGQTVVATGAPVRVPVGTGLLGRVLDGLGRPIDDGPAPRITREMPVDADPPRRWDVRRSRHPWPSASAASTGSIPAVSDSGSASSPGRASGRAPCSA